MESRIDDVSTFLKWVAEITKHFNFRNDDPWTPWFRGQPTDLDLLPKFYRGEYGNEKRRKKWKIEDETREEFIVRAPALSENVPAPNDDWGWYFLMQHFGAPTRLLDWTESALLALYFAVKDNQGLTNAVVWALDPYQLNRITIGWKRDWLICPNVTGLGDKDAESVKKWLPERFTKNKGLPSKPIAIYPTHMERRIGAQRSGFTIHGTNPNGLDEIAADKNGNVLTKTTIPAFRVQAIRKELAACGIDESTAFPDLDGLGRSLSLKWQECPTELPHENVLTRLRPSTVCKGGVGVFAITEIKKGTPLFQEDLDEMLWVDEHLISRTPQESYALYHDFAVIDKKKYGCPKNFNRLTVSWYINEPRNSDAPNVKCDPETYEFFAKKDIHKGEELTVRYLEYSENPPD